MNERVKTGLSVLAVSLVIGPVAGLIYCLVSPTYYLQVQFRSTTGGYLEQDELRAELDQESLQSVRLFELRQVSDSRQPIPEVKYTFRLDQGARPPMWLHRTEDGWFLGDGRPVILSKFATTWADLFAKRKQLEQKLAQTERRVQVAEVAVAFPRAMLADDVPLPVQTARAAAARSGHESV